MIPEKLEGWVSAWGKEESATMFFPKNEKSLRPGTWQEKRTVQSPAMHCTMPLVGPGGDQGGRAL